MELQEVGWRGAWNGSIWPWTGAGSGPHECGNELLGTIKCRDFLEDQGILVQFTLYVRNGYFFPKKSQTGPNAPPPPQPLTKWVPGVKESRGETDCCTVPTV